MFEWHDRKDHYYALLCKIKLFDIPQGYALKLILWSLEYNINSTFSTMMTEKVKVACSGFFFIYKFMSSKHELYAAANVFYWLFFIHGKYEHTECSIKRTGIFYVVGSGDTLNRSTRRRRFADTAAVPSPSRPRLQEARLGRQTSSLCS